MSNRIAYLLVTTCVLFGATRCKHEPLEGTQTRSAVIALSLQTASSRINEDHTLWEDRVDEVRMIVFAPGGRVVYNGLLEFPSGMDQSCRPVRITPGIYDFCFIANETASAEGLSEALATLTTKSDLQTNPLFQNLPWSETFRPDGTTSGGRFLMSAQYDDIPVLSGGTEENPVLLKLPTDKVELIRAMAKVEVIFRKKEAGSTIPAGVIGSVQLTNVAQYMSVPPAENASEAAQTATSVITPTDFDYQRDSLGALVWYIPERLNEAGAEGYTRLHINDEEFPVSSESPYAVTRNNHYQITAYINPQGGVELEVCVEPWNRVTYKYMFQDEDRTIAIPPVTPTDTSVIVPTDCGTVEILSYTEKLPQGLMGAFGDQINWWDPAVGGPSITKGKEPFYCEKKYGKGWRFINSCELMSFLRIFDQAYRVWQGNTSIGYNNGLPSQSLAFRQEAQALLAKLTGYDMSKFTPTDTGLDTFGGEKLGMIDQFFTPGDILVIEDNYQGNWPYESKPNNNGQKWFPMEVSIQVKAYWYSDYININLDENVEKILFLNFAMYNYSSTVSRCVRNL